MAQQPLPIKSFGIETMKEGDTIYSVSLRKEGKKFSCYLDEYKIKKFLAKENKFENTKVDFDKYNVELTAIDGTTLNTNLRNGFCDTNKENKIALVEAFKKDIEAMNVAVKKCLMDVIKEE